MGEEGGGVAIGMGLEQLDEGTIGSQSPDLVLPSLESDWAAQPSRPITGTLGS